jgi:DNA-nicking Smr family endonuclease
MTRRRLTKEEMELWLQVAERTERLAPERKKPAHPLPKPKPTKAPAVRTPRFVVGQAKVERPMRHDLKAPLADQLSSAPLQMDRKAFGRMKRGKLTPEGRIDLHGMTLDRAHPALIRFILSSQASGKRLVLVITGKGRAGSDDGPIPTPKGILKHQVPHWLSIPPLAQAVLQISQAHLSHGGGGAYYVYLRKGR